MGFQSMPVRGKEEGRIRSRNILTRWLTAGLILMLMMAGILLPASLAAASAPVDPNPDPAEEKSQPLNAQPVGEALSPLPPVIVLVVADFESGASGWTAARDETTATSISCEVEQGKGSQGSAAMRIDYSVSAGSWATCSLMYEEPQDWSAGEWLALNLFSAQAGLPFSVNLYTGGQSARETYLVDFQTAVVYGEEFNAYTILWKDFLRADGEENAGMIFDKPGQVAGLAFGVNGNADSPNTGTIWIDNIRLEKSPSYEGVTEPPFLRWSFPCLGSLALPLVLVGLAWLIRRR
jgi:hypothetical protein